MSRLRLVVSVLAISCAAPSCDRSAESRAQAEPAQTGPRGQSQSAPEAASPARELTWVYAESPVGPMQVVVSIPKATAQQRFPVLIAMHGRGEAFKGPARGARGWIDDYGLARALDRLAHPPLTSADLGGFYDAKHLARLNAFLTEQPYRGLIVVMPYTPDILAGPRAFEAAEPLARFLVDELLGRVQRETPALGRPSATGIDGVSLGGRASLLVGLLRPRAFGVVAALQAAFDADDASRLVKLAERARVENPAIILRLLTSDEDYFLRANREISRALGRARIAHEFSVVPGPHDYQFNRGPGAFEMLLFHHRALRRQ